MKDLQDLLLKLMFKHFLFGMNYGLPKLGFNQFCDSLSLPDILHLNKLLLIARSSIMLRLIVKLLQNKVRPPFKRNLNFRLIRCICYPVLFSLSPRGCYFESFAEIKDRPNSTKTNVPICAKKGEYIARAGDDLMNNSIVFLTFRSIRRMILAHFSKVSAIAFHPFLPILVTCDSNVKHAKFWYIPSELSSDPVLISILHTHDLIVSSIVFHPELPFVIFGGTNGTIQVWRAKIS